MVAMTAMLVSIVVGATTEPKKSQQVSSTPTPSSVFTCEDYIYESIVDPGKINKYTGEKVIDLMIADGSIGPSSDKKAMMAERANELETMVSSLVELCETQPSKDVEKIIEGLYEKQ